MRVNAMHNLSQVPPHSHTARIDTRTNKHTLAHVYHFDRITFTTTTQNSFNLCSLSSARYVAKRLDDLLYELSLTGAYVATSENNNTGGDAKRRKIADDAPSADTEAHADAELPPAAAVERVVVSDFDVIRDKAAEYDAAREDVIKRCRDAQKLSKNAIYSLHRGALDAAVTQLTKVTMAKTANIYPVQHLRSIFITSSPIYTFDIAVQMIISFLLCCHVLNVAPCRVVLSRADFSVALYRVLF